MKAVLFPKYGSPDVLQIADVEKPTPTDNQVLVKVYMASVNPLDWHRMRGEPFLARLSEGYFTPKNPKLGADIVGQVEAVGKNVTDFKPGDEVFGSIFAGGFAEYACADEKYFVLKPATISFEAAASAPVVGLTAIQGLRDFGHIQSGQNVLVNGASGGVGMFAVQYAKSVGAEVTGVTSTRNLDLVRSIGADHVVDYTQQDFTQAEGCYDLIYDAIGNRSVFDLRRALKPQGVAVIAGFTKMSLMFQHLLVGPRVSKVGGKKIGMMSTAKVTNPDMVLIKDLLASDKVAPVIDRCYPFSEIADAVRYLETSRARGKVVVEIAQPE
jgi:NADPH:quinone reductase-like Zn-dependent oxidoreductase